MLRQRSDQAFLLFLALVDVAVASASWTLAHFIRWDLGWIPPAYGVTPPWWWCIRTIPIIAVCIAFSYQVCRLYQLRRRWTLIEETARVVQATGLALLLILAVTFYSKNPYESRIASVLFFGMTTVGVIGVRRGLAIYFRWRRQHGRFSAKALIVGTGKTARGVNEALVRNNWLGIQPFGFVDDVDSSIARRVPTVGRIDEIARLVEEHGIEYVFIALPLRRFEETRRVFLLLSSTLCDVRLIPDVPQLATMSVHIDEMEGLPVLSFRQARGTVLSLAIKRLMDIAGALAGLLILSPILAVIAILVKRSDGGPILYKQERMGLNGCRFKMLKFRTMRVDAETGTGPVWAQAGDARRTRLGSFLRETSLDELPQLWNVLRGEMSLVGPRPERPFFIHKFRESIPRYMVRHAVKAGITGWAQVNGWRGNTSLRKRVQYDLYYISNWSIWLDVRILFLTLFRVLRDKNAY